MSAASQLISDYSRIRQRLMSPPNAVIDRGIDLRRKRIPEEPIEPPKEEVLDHAAFYKACCVTITQIPRPIRPVENRTVRLVTIERAVCTYFGITERALHGPSRGHLIVYPRHIYYYLCRTHTRHSYPAIAAHGGRPRLIRRNKKLITIYGRDHTVIMYAHRKVEEMMLVDDRTVGIVKILEFMIFGDHKATNGVSRETSSSPSVSTNGHQAVV